MLRPNTLKSKLAEGRTVVGTWCSLPSPSVVSVVATTGLDFAIIDMEHGSMSFETAENMVRAAQTTEMTPIVRTSDDRENTILRSLEIGSQAVMVPHVETPEDAAAVVRASRYHPGGARGLGPYTRVHDYTHDGLTASLARANEQMFVGILVEGADGIARLDRIAAVPGLDLVYLGIYDISQSVGVPGQLEHPKVVDGLKRSAETIRASGCHAGSYAKDLAYAERLIAAGFDFVAYYVDVGAMRDHYVGALGALQPFVRG